MVCYGGVNLGLGGVKESINQKQRDSVVLGAEDRFRPARGFLPVWDICSIEAIPFFNVTDLKTRRSPLQTFAPPVQVLRRNGGVRRRLLKVTVDTAGLEQRDGRVLGGKAGGDKQGFAHLVVELFPVDSERAVHRRLVADEVLHSLFDGCPVIELLQIGNRREGRKLSKIGTRQLDLESVTDGPARNRCRSWQEAPRASHR